MGQFRRAGGRMCPGGRPCDLLSGAARRWGASRSVGRWLADNGRTDGPCRVESAVDGGRASRRLSRRPTPHTLPPRTPTCRRTTNAASPARRPDDDPCRLPTTLLPRPPRPVAPVKVQPAARHPSRSSSRPAAAQVRLAISRLHPPRSSCRHCRRHRHPRAMHSCRRRAARPDTMMPSVRIGVDQRHRLRLRRLATAR